MHEINNTTLILQVNERLNDIMSKMDYMTLEIKASDAFNAWLTTYIEYENTIRNGAVKLQRVRRDISEVITVKEKMKIAKEFVDYFENNDIEGNVLNVYRLTAQQSTATTRNLFALYIDNFGCDVAALAKLMMVIKDVMALGAQQVLSYHNLKGSSSRAVKYYHECISQLYDIRRVYEEYVSYCYQEAIPMSKYKVQKLLTSGRDISNPNMAKDIFTKLVSLYPFYAWAVISTDRTDTPNMEFHCDPKGYFDWCIWLKSTLTEKGEQYFSITGKYHDGSRQIWVLWQDLYDRLSCANRNKANTVVFYLRGKGFSGTDFGGSASDKILTQPLCNNDVFKTPPAIEEPYPGYRKNVVREAAKWNWVAVGETRPWTGCDSEESCNGHGICQTVPFTRQVICFCDSRYDGEHCEEYEDTLNEENISKLSQLQSTFGQTVGIPDIIDIYFALQDLAKSMQDGFQAVMAANEYMETLIKYSEDLKKSQYIASLYDKWRQGDITERTFGVAMADFIEKSDSLPYIIQQLKHALMAGGILDMEGQDIFNTYKKAYVSKFKNACTVSYNDDIKDMYTKLAGLDLLISEALFQYVQVSKRYSDIKVGTELVKFAEDNLEASKNRLQEYDQYWQKTSCGLPPVAKHSDIHCPVKHSFIGMVAPVTCSGGYRPSPSSMTCASSNGILLWNSNITCNSYWGSWSSWAGCEKTCHSCTVSRQRKRIPTGESQNESKTMTLKKCPNMIYHGDTIRLESKLRPGGYLDCHEWYCKLRTKRYYGQGFKIKSPNGDSRTLIRNRQVIGMGLGSVWISSEGGWRKIKNSDCPNRHPDFLNVHSTQSQCRAEIWRFYNPYRPHNTPLYIGDILYVRIEFGYYWVSTNDWNEEVTARDCPAHGEIKSGCTTELWKVHRFS